MKAVALTPLHLKLILHYAVSDAPFYCPSQAANDYTCDLLQWGLAQKTAYGYGATSLGRAFVDMLCNTPIPEVGFFDPRDNRRVEPKRCGGTPLVESRMD